MTDRATADAKRKAAFKAALNGDDPKALRRFTRELMDEIGRCEQHIERLEDGLRSLQRQHRNPGHLADVHLRMGQELGRLDGVMLRFVERRKGKR